MQFAELAPQIARQSLDDFGAPALLTLPCENRSPNVPVQNDEPAVHRKHRLNLGGVNADLQFLEQRRIIKDIPSKWRGMLDGRTYLPVY